MSDDHLLAEVEDGIGTLVLNRPGQLNALSDAMVATLIAETGRFEADPKVRCVVIRASGDHFLAGGDVVDFARRLTEDRDRHLATIEQRVLDGHVAISRLRRMGKPVLVAIQGAVAGFGIGLVGAADLAIASEDAFFCMAYRNIGLTADGGSSYFLPRLVGERRALEMTLLGERLDAARAKDWGLVNWVVPRIELDAETRRIATVLAEGPTRALGQAKRLMRTSIDTGWDEQSAREAASIARAMATDDHLEGLTAFREKRRPRFSGA